MRYGSLCSGIGGLDRSVETVWPDATPAWFCEYDSHAASVLHRWWPGVPVLPDLKSQDWTTVERVELVTAGYPCQPFSHAGQRRGTDDPRHLWPYVIDAVRVLRPRLVVLENVAGHLGLGFDAVLGDLAEAGFDADWCVVPASEAGACHRRERLFVLAYSSCSGAGRNARAVPRATATSGRQGFNLCASVDGGATPPDTESVEQREPVVRMGKRPEPRRSGADVPDSDGLAGATAVPRGRGRGAVDEPGTLERTERLRGPSAPDPDIARLEGPEPARGHVVPSWGDYEPAIRRWEHVLGRPAPAPTDERGRLSVDFVEWMQGFDAGWVDGLTRTAALKCLGNAVVQQQGVMALEFLRGAA